MYQSYLKVELQQLGMKGFKKDEWSVQHVLITSCNDVASLQAAIYVYILQLVARNNVNSIGIIRLGSRWDQKIYICYFQCSKSRLTLVGRWRGD